MNVHPDFGSTPIRQDLIQTGRDTNAIRAGQRLGKSTLCADGVRPVAPPRAASWPDVALSPRWRHPGFDRSTFALKLLHDAAVQFVV